MSIPDIVEKSQLVTLPTHHSPVFSPAHYMVTLCADVICDHIGRQGEQEALQSPVQSAPPVPLETPRPLRTRRPGEWFWVDTAIVATYGPQIGAYGVAVYVALASHAKGKTQDCWPSIARLASELSLSRATVKRTLRKLREVKLIATNARTDPAGDPTSNTYTLLDPTPDKPVTLAAVPQGGRVSESPPSGPADPTGRVSQTPKPDPNPPKPEERTRASEDRSAEGKKEPKDETPNWNTPAFALPTTPTDRPDDHLKQLPVDPETFTRLYRLAEERLIVQGLSPQFRVVPRIQSEMLAIYEEEQAPSALPAAG
jgi:hypothetical protein